MNKESLQGYLSPTQVKSGKPLARALYMDVHIVKKDAGDENESLSRVKKNIRLSREEQGGKDKDGPRKMNEEAPTPLVPNHHSSPTHVVIEPSSI